MKPKPGATFGAMLLLTIVGGCAPAATTGSTDSGGEVRNLILLIADGAGVGVWTAGGYAKPDLSVTSMPVVGMIDTRSAFHRVTDSAAGAVAYATGTRVTNRTISVGPPSACPQPSPRDTTRVWPTGCEPLESWLELARDKGKATGIVTTAAVVDATPAAFVAHSPSRYWSEEIAVQFADFGLDVLLGGGRRYFAGEQRSDGLDLLGALCRRSQCISTATELSSYQSDDRPLVGLLAEGDMDDLTQRPASLSAMVGAALARLGRDPAGFVAVIETEATDNATHANAPLGRVTADFLDFDEAVGVALDFARRTPGTLVIATADHETGGFSLVEAGVGFELVYTTGLHTAAWVPLAAEGPQADRFGGFHDNAEIGQLLMEIVSSW